MTHLRAILLATALGAAMAATPPAADITPEGLWQTWQDRAEAAGHVLDATVDQGGTLGLDGVTFARPLGTGRITLRADRLDLAQDGPDVRVTLQAGATVTVTTVPGDDDPDGETVEAVIALGDTALGATVAGDAAAPVWTLAADTASVTLVSLTRDGTPVPAEARIDLAGLAGTLSGLGGGGPLMADLRADRLASDIAATDPDSGDTIRSTATQSDTTLRASLTEGGDGDAPAAGVLRATLTGGASESVSLRSGPSGSFESDSRQDSARLDLTLTETRTEYDAQVAGLATTLSGSLLPSGPLGLGVANADLALSLPAAPGDGLQTARLAVDLDGVLPDDRLWALLDPMGALPRQPAEATLRAEADLDTPDPDAALPGGMEMPGLLPRALRIDEIAVQLGDASVRGDGAFDIPAGPMGVPDAALTVGAIHLLATGLNGLMERAIAAGALSMEQAMGAQMMLGMFATQGEGDSFTSRIELLPGGGLMVNGARLR